MGKTLALTFVILTALICLSACSTRSRQLTDDELANISLPFDSDGSFIVTLPIVNDYDEIHSFGNFTFGGVERWYSGGGVTWSRQYRATNLHLYASDFIGLMSSLTPILVDAVAICTLGTNDWLSTPFRSLAREDSLYFWARNDFYIQMIGVRMSVYEMRGYGYLSISLTHWVNIGPYAHRVRHDDTIHHFLYRISPSDLERFSAFAEGLERGTEIWHGHSTFTRCQRRTVAIAAALGLLVAIWSCVVIFKARRANQTTRTWTWRNLLRKTIFVSLGLIALCTFIMRNPMTRYLDPIVWIVIAYFAIVAGLAKYASVCTNNSKRM